MTRPAVSCAPDLSFTHWSGLIPIKCDPNKFDFVIDEEETDADTLVFHLEYVCPDLPPNIERDADGFPILSK